MTFLLLLLMLKLAFYNLQAWERDIGHRPFLAAAVGIE